MNLQWLIIIILCDFLFYSDNNRQSNKAGGVIYVYQPIWLEREMYGEKLHIWKLVHIAVLVYMT